LAFDYDVEALPIAASKDSDLLALLQNLTETDVSDYRNISEMRRSNVITRQ